MVYTTLGCVFSTFSIIYSDTSIINSFSILIYYVLKTVFLYINTSLCGLQVATQQCVQQLQPRTGDCIKHRVMYPRI